MKTNSEISTPESFSAFQKLRAKFGEEDCGPIDYARLAFEQGYNIGRKSAGVSRPVEPICRGCNGTRKRSTAIARNKHGEIIGFDEVPCPDCLSRPVEAQTPRLTIAENLLDRAATFMEDQAVRDDPNWWREYFLFTGQHMILTDEGWESGDSKQPYLDDLAKGIYDESPIIDEINAPDRPVPAPPADTPATTYFDGAAARRELEAMGDAAIVGKKPPTDTPKRGLCNCNWDGGHEPHCEVVKAHDRLMRPSDALNSPVIPDSSQVEKPLTDPLTKELVDALRWALNQLVECPTCGRTGSAPVCSCFYGLELSHAQNKLARYGAVQDTPEPAQQLDTREREMELALRNCRMLAQREIRNHEGAGQKPTGVKTFAAWKHILRFCEEAGVTGSIFGVDADTPSDKEKA